MIADEEWPLLSKKKLTGEEQALAEELTVAETDSDSFSQGGGSDEEDENICFDIVCKMVLCLVLGCVTVLGGFLLFVMCGPIAIITDIYAMPKSRQAFAKYIDHSVPASAARVVKAESYPTQLCSIRDPKTFRSNYYSFRYAGGWAADYQEGQEVEVLLLPTDPKSGHLRDMIEHSLGINAFCLRFNTFAAGAYVWLLWNYCLVRCLRAPLDNVRTIQGTVVVVVAVVNMVVMAAATKFVVTMANNPDTKLVFRQPFSWGRGFVGTTHRVTEIPLRQVDPRVVAASLQTLADSRSQLSQPQ